MSPTAVDRVAGVLREQILDARLEAGTRLVEADLVELHGAARHTVRTALRVLADEGLVTIAPNRGARVAGLDGDAITALYELRAALEVEAAHLALARHGDRLPPSVHEAAEVLARACSRPRPRWSTVSRAHADLHTSLVRAARSPRIEAVHDRLTAQTRLFLLQVRPHYTFARLGEEHLQLVVDLEAQGPEVLRTHLRVAAGSVVDGVPRNG
ncbi:MAG TPA: GntR family transcriptional regulator [Baekduia sp.]|uniref:GntR family transcriptional regulator n=1 Tax=Baekduia sp. TaxID=2600305 RepID=UPI002C806B62|nr:GntR family transcriptional regulator [Baekduia sp.]HMJ36637.1 GntR family transcriptional regulator [Baekduia sp.]